MAFNWVRVEDVIPKNKELVLLTHNKGEFEICKTDYSGGDITEPEIEETDKDGLTVAVYPATHWCRISAPEKIGNYHAV